MPNVELQCILVVFWLGGIVTASCHHGVIYALKVLLRGESVRDHIDVLMSLKYLPNLVINDMPGMTAKHGNHRQTDMFHPNEGRFAENTPDNLQQLKEGRLEVSIGFFDVRQDSVEDCDIDSESHLHPTTKSGDVYCAVDQFHLKNIATEADKLRNIKLVKELRGQVNTQVQEQFFSCLRRDIYFLNSLSPVNFLFLLRLLIHFRNNEICLKQRQSVQKLLESCGIEVSVGSDGRLNNVSLGSAEGTSPDEAVTNNENECIVNETSVSLVMECNDDLQTEILRPMTCDLPFVSNDSDFGAMTGLAVQQSVGSGEHQHTLRPMPKKVYRCLLMFTTKCFWLS